MEIDFVIVHQNIVVLLFSTGKQPLSSCLSFLCLMMLLYHSQDYVNRVLLLYCLENNQLEKNTGMNKIYLVLNLCRQTKKYHMEIAIHVPVIFQSQDFLLSGHLHVLHHLSSFLHAVACRAALQSCCAGELLGRHSSSQVPGNSYAIEGSVWTLPSILSSSYSSS